MLEIEAEGVTVRLPLNTPAARIAEAARYKRDLKAKYDQLIAAGKPPKVALTARMPKLLILTIALIRDRRKWTPNLP